MNKHSLKKWVQYFSNTWHCVRYSWVSTSGTRTSIQLSSNSNRTQNCGEKCTFKSSSPLMILKTSATLLMTQKKSIWNTLKTIHMTRHQVKISLSSLSNQSKSRLGWEPFSPPLSRKQTRYKMILKRQRKTCPLSDHLIEDMTLTRKSGIFQVTSRLNCTYSSESTTTPCLPTSGKWVFINTTSSSNYSTTSWPSARLRSKGLCLSSFSSRRWLLQICRDLSASCTNATSFL